MNLQKGENSIGWCDYTLNQLTGCLNHIDGMCKGGNFPCYAYKLAHGRLKERYLANKNLLHDNELLRKYDSPFYPRFWPERFKPLKGYPEGTKVFLNDMSDWMPDWIPDEWKLRILNFIKAHPQYIFQTLTKQPQNLAKWSPYPSNCWVGVTATDTITMWHALANLEKIKASIKFISFEPLLNWDSPSVIKRWYAILHIVDWLIIGACTGTKQEMVELQKKYSDLTLMPYGNRWTAQPKIEWVEEIESAANKAGIPVFEKDNLKPLLDYNLRQEFLK